MQHPSILLVEELEIAVNALMNEKATGNDNLPAELVQATTGMGVVSA